MIFILYAKYPTLYQRNEATPAVYFDQIQVLAAPESWLNYFFQPYSKKSKKSTKKDKIEVPPQASFCMSTNFEEQEKYEKKHVFCSFSDVFC